MQRPILCYPDRMSRVATIPFTSYTESVAAAMDAVGAASRIPRSGRICLKPNLTNDSPPPVTTPAACVEAVYDWLRPRTEAEIFIGEGCGSGGTPDVFRRLGYEDLARRKGIGLEDFNTTDVVESHAPDAVQWRDLKIPSVLADTWVVSIPILKDHSFTGTTIAMKNMFGIVPGPFYGGSWNKSKMHSPSTHRSVVDVCLHKKPDLCIVDAVTALTGMHLAGTPLKLNLILASFDPVAVDSEGSRLLGHDPRDLDYLKMADAVMGRIDPDAD